VAARNWASTPVLTRDRGAPCGVIDFAPVVRNCDFGNDVAVRITGNANVAESVRPACTSDCHRGRTSDENLRRVRARGFPCELVAPPRFTKPLTSCWWSSMILRPNRRNTKRVRERLTSTLTRHGHSRVLHLRESEDIGAVIMEVLYSATERVEHHRSAASRALARAERKNPTFPHWC